MLQNKKIQWKKNSSYFHPIRIVHTFILSKNQIKRLSILSSNKKCPYFHSIKTVHTFIQSKLSILLSHQKILSKKFPYFHPIKKMQSKKVSILSSNQKCPYFHPLSSCTRWCFTPGGVHVLPWCLQGPVLPVGHLDPGAPMRKTHMSSLKEEWASSHTIGWYSYIQIARE